MDDDVLLYLPEDCANLNAETKDLLQQETNSFNEFNARLNEFDPNIEKFEERYQIYNEGQLLASQNETTLALFVNCSIRQRIHMIPGLDQSSLN